MASNLTPTFGIGYQSFKDDGTVNSGGFIYTYLARTTTATATWTTIDQTVQNGNPITLDAYGRPALGEIWLQSGIQYKFVIADSNNVPLTHGTYDDISGINDVSFSQNQWITISLQPLYLTTSTFSLQGDQTGTFVAGTRLQCQETAGLVSGTVVSSSYTSPSTVITVILDNGATLDSGLSTVSVSLLTGSPTAVPSVFGTTPIHVTAASTTLIGVPTTTVIVDGNTTINSFGVYDEGAIRFVQFTGTPTLTSSSALSLPGGVNKIVLAGDTATFVSFGSGNWVCTQYQSNTLNTPVEAIYPITATVDGSNNLVVGLNACTLEFRNFTLASGPGIIINVPTVLSLSIVSGATLGTDATKNRLVLLALNNAGTVSLGITNLFGHLQLDETNLVSTTAMTTASDSAAVIYSAAALTGVAYKVLGFIDSVQSVAGTWAAAPTLVQGAGGNVRINQVPEFLNYGGTADTGTITRSYIGPVKITYYGGVLEGGADNLSWNFYLNGSIINGTTASVNYVAAFNPSFAAVFMANGNFTFRITQYGSSYFTAAFCIDYL